MADMEKSYDDLIIITRYMGAIEKKMLLKKAFLFHFSEAHLPPK